MTFAESYLFSALGVVLSVLIPVLASAVRAQFATGAPVGVGWPSRFFRLAWKAIRPYLVLAAFSLAAAAIIVATQQGNLQTPAAAIVAGYLWDSTLQKLTGRPQSA